MALDFSDGCTKSTTVSQIYPLAPSGVAYVTGGQGAFGTNAVEVQPNVTLPIQTSQFATRYDQFWLNYQTQPTSSNQSCIWQAYDSVAGSCQLSLYVNATGQLLLYRGLGATLLVTYSAGLAAGGQNNFEIGVTIASSGGSCQVYLNGSLVINYSGNTQNSSHAYTDQCRLGPPQNATNYNHFYSHLAIYDPSGAAPNGFVGVKRFYTLVPAADSATSGLNQFSTSPSQTTGNHYKNVDTTPQNGGSSYNYSPTVSQRESYRTAGLPSTVSGIVVINCFVLAEIDAAGAHSINIVARNGTTDNVTTAQFLNATYAYYNVVLPLDPNTGAGWTTTGYGTGTLSNAEFGIEVAS